MSSIVLVHEVGDFDTWVAKPNRAALFAQVCSSYRLYRMPDAAKVAIVAEDADVEKLQQMLGSPEAAAAMAEDTVLAAVDLYRELEGAR